MSTPKDAIGGHRPCYISHDGSVKLLPSREEVMILLVEYKCRPCLEKKQELGQDFPQEEECAQCRGKWGDED